MVHQYKNNGYDIVLDVNSGAIHVVDDVTYDVIDFINQASVEQYSKEELIKTLSEKYNETEVKGALEEVQALIDEESLFTKDTYENYIMDFKKRPTVVKALCLHIAHDCNLACQYCFAEEGEYHGRRALMSFEVGKKALDFLIANSGSRRNLEVEIGRVKKKMAAGATFFLTQPISTKESADRVRRIKEETGARILCGIMPFVSLKNATFMKNEMAGIDVTDEVLARYRADMTREEGEQAGVQLANKRARDVEAQIIALTKKQLEECRTDESNSFTRC